MTRQNVFQLPEPAYEQYSWVLQDEHGPSSLPPLLIDDGRYGSSRPGEVPVSLRIHGFHYVRASGRRGGPPWAAGAPTPARSVEDLRRWRVDWLPEVEKVVQVFESFDPASVQPGRWAATINAQEDLYMHAFGGIHRTAPGPAHAAYRAYVDAFEDRFGQERSEDMHALLQGVPNCSFDRAGALWDLSRLLRASPALGEALDRGAQLPDTPAAHEFRDGFAAMIATYGHTSNNDLQELPVWREDPQIPMAAIRAYARQEDDASPYAAATRQRERRLALEAELHALAASGDAAVARILEYLPAAQEVLPNIEDHNFLADQRQIAASRYRWMAIGHFLAGKGLLDAAEDVFYIEPGEIIPVLEGYMAPDRGVLAERKRQLRLARASSPPPVLGQPLDIAKEASDATPRFNLDGSAVRVVRGVAASPGVFRGKARLIETLEEAASLEPGDVLIARTTNPAWTPYFALISALVTNSGGMLSHASVVAREFGIPAVIGTLNGTAQIPDGATVTVDGTNGLVLVE